MEDKNRYKVIYMEDFFTVIHETVIECNSDEIEQKAHEYQKEHLSHETDIAGANWNRI